MSMTEIAGGREVRVSEVTKLVLVQLAVTLIDDEIGGCRGRIVGPGADLEPEGWPAFAEGGQFHDDIVDCVDALFAHAGGDIWECALDVLEDPDVLPPDPFEDLGDLCEQVAALTAELDHARSSVLRLSAMEWVAKAAREERDAAIAERDALRAKVEQLTTEIERLRG